MAGDLIVIYGPPLSGKTTLAWELGRRFAAKTAVLSSDQLLAGSIAVSDADAAAELEMAHTQMRLLVANYLKNGYHVVVEGPFLFERGGGLHSFEADIDQLVALMRHLTQHALVVRLTASAAVLRERAFGAGREATIESVLRQDAAFKARQGERFLQFDTSAQSAAEIATILRAALMRPD